MEKSEISQLIKCSESLSSLSISETPLQSYNTLPGFYQNQKKLSIFTCFSITFLIISVIALYFAITCKSKVQTLLIFACVLLVNVSAFCVFSSVVWCFKQKHSQIE
ncbi:Hypothetical_protein [Hexamita inflata]|uniref:Hypothetical_protein n=1 Tax=Hexamita inflata TaxID=28002 RepID=A0AA86NS09_9EUKA|nr:Hypothetical protein HINF_LOCUS11420 [Hexamita inflata]